MPEVVHIGFDKDLKFILTWGTKTLTCRHAPVNWDEAFIKWERSEKYHGLFRSYAQDLEFVKDGAYFLRRIFYRANSRVGSEVTLTVQKRNRTTLAFQTIFTGDIDFMTFTDSRDTVKVTVKEGGLSKLIKLNEEREYNIEIIGSLTYRKLTTPPAYVDYTFSYEPYITMFIELLDAMTGGRVTSGEYGIETDFTALNNGLTTGKAIRVQGAETTYIRTSFAKFMRDFKIINFAGCGVIDDGGTEKLYIATLDKFYDAATKVYDLGQVRDFVLSVDETKVFSNLKIGYPDVTYKVQSADDEINQSSEWLTSRENGNETLDLVCSYRADATLILEILEGDLTDESYDSELLHIINRNNAVALPPPINEPAGYTPERGYVYKNPAGTGYSNYAHNVGISPRRTLTEWLTYLNSCLDGEQGFTIQQIAWAGENNLNCGQQYFLQAIIEEASALTLTTDRLFYPYLFRFEAPVGYDFFDTIAANPLGYVKFTYRNQDYKGFLQSGAVSIANKTIIDITLLACPDNDLTTLIRV